jgi:hypothetical protein
VKPPNGDGPAGHLTPEPAPEEISSPLSAVSTNEPIVRERESLVKSSAVRKVLTIDLSSHVEEGGWLGDNARHRIYHDSLGLTQDMAVRLCIGAARGCADYVVREAAWWLRSAAAVQVEGANGFGVAQFAEDFEQARRSFRKESAA